VQCGLSCERQLTGAGVVQPLLVQGWHRAALLVVHWHRAALLVILLSPGLQAIEKKKKDRGTWLATFGSSTTQSLLNSSLHTECISRCCLERLCKRAVQE
jgi:hypothetical protein